MSDEHREEIAKLEALYAENPEGRIFTHLAEACRKAGELDRAREVLANGIEQHPEYSSAHVVLGRVLMDLDEHAEARAEFRRVLELDPQNLVALRSLGDIARLDGHVDEALDRYRELLDREPSDTEVRELVKELSGEGPPVTQEAEGEEPAPAPAGPAGDEAADPGPGAPFLATTDEETGPSTGDAPVAELDSTEPPAADGTESRDDAGAGGGEFDVGELATAEEEARRAEAERFKGSAFDASELGGTAEEADAEVADEEVADEAGSLELSDATDEETVAELKEQFAGKDLEDADVMTETIAQVYARQGLYDRAAEVYRGLVRENPDDEELQERLAEMEAKAGQGTEAGSEEAATGGEIETDAPPEPSETETGQVAGFESGELDTAPDEEVGLAGFEAEDAPGSLVGADAEDAEPDSATPPPVDGLVGARSPDEVEATATPMDELVEGPPGVYSDEPQTAGTDEPEVDEAEVEEAEVDEVEVDEAEVEEPEPAGTGELVTEELIAEEPMVDEPVADEPVADEPMVDEEPIASASAEERKSLVEELAAEAEQAFAGGALAPEETDREESVAEEAVEEEPGGEELFEEEPFEEEPVDTDAVIDEMLVEAPADVDTDEVAEAEPEPALEEESPWTDDEWADQEAETPYAWADEEEEEDTSAPIGEYLGGLLEWNGGSAATGASESEAEVEPEPAVEPESAEEEEAESEGLGPMAGLDDDDDLEMFRSWLESLKQ